LRVTLSSSDADFLSLAAATLVEVSTSVTRPRFTPWPLRLGILAHRLRAPR
jgi:hypothetical protein